jgi:hypothetical protein
MNGFGLNRAALNGSVRAVIAGAALAIATGGISAAGTRVVTDAPQFAATGGVAPTGTRIASGAANTVANSTIQATPGLLYLSSANFGTDGALLATNTESYFAASGTLQASGTDIQNGSASFMGNSIGTTAIPLYIAGNAATFATWATLTADASDKPSGSSYNYRDGYVNTVPIGGTLTASALRTAMCAAESDAPSSFAAIGGQIQGGSTQLAGAGALTALGAADAGWSIMSGSLTALGQVTQYPAPIVMAGSLILSESHNVLTQGTANVFTGVASLQATGNLAIQSDGPFQSASVLSASGTIYKMAGAESDGVGALSATGGLLYFGNALYSSASTLTASALVNAESLDPVERTMRRPFVDRVMLRPTVDRVMKRNP